ncbi:MAG: hypothetical protein ACE14P_13885 [Methanotrichaceae archaeon]
MLLLVASVIISTSAGIEPIALGQGRADKAINLDMGSRHSSITPKFGMNGFASPLVLQPMELDPGAMVTQSQRFRDQSQALRDQSSAIYNGTAVLLEKTSAFAAQVENDKARVEVLKEDASASADSSLRSALMAGDYLNNTRAVYGDTRMLYNLTRISERKVETAIRMNIPRAMGGVSTYNNVPAGASDVGAVQQEVLILSEKVDTLERRISELEGASRTK